MNRIDYMIFRKKNHITLKTIAKICNCSIGLLSLFERDLVNMSDEKVEKYDKFIKFELNNIDKHS